MLWCSIHQMKLMKFLRTIGPEGSLTFRIMHPTIDLGFPLLYGMQIFILFNHLASLLSKSFEPLPELGLLTAVNGFCWIFLTYLHHQSIPLSLAKPGEGGSNHNNFKIIVNYHLSNIDRVSDPQKLVNGTEAKNDLMMVDWLNIQNSAIIKHVQS